MAVAQSWAYKGRDASGKVVKGTIDAPSEAAVTSRLRTIGVTPLSITEGGGSGLNAEINIGFLEKGVGLKDLAIMSRQMATMIGAGILLLQALNILAEQTESKLLGKTLKSVRSDVEAGTALSLAMGKFPKIFPPLMLSLIKAGEAGGFLESSLESVAINYEKEVKLRGAVKSALTYPVIVLIMSLVSVVGMIVFIVPTFKKMFDSLNTELPPPTQFLVWLSGVFPYLAPVLAALVIGFAIWWKGHKNDENVRQFLDPLKLKLPVFGKLTAKIAIARFTRNFSTMIKSGVPILTCLAIVGETSGNWVIERALESVAESVRVGQSIAKPLSAQPVFPTMVTQMIAVGEDAGALDTMLGKIADFYDDEVQATTDQLTALIEPLMIAFLGLVVGGMIVALYLPIFGIIGAINK
jgi:type IV pilus assembly protein PilC